MSANITDYFNKASSMNGSYPPVATVTAARSTGGSTLSCDSLSGWATDTPVHFSTFQVKTDGTIDTTTQTDWKGIVSGNTITDMTRLAGAADSGNASGDKVELNPTIGWVDDLVTGLLVAHKQNGALKDNAVTESSIATGAVTSTKVAAGAISSYDKISDNVIQARNIDFTTMPGNYSTSEVDTGYTWIDGKEIYKKTLTTTDIPGANGEKALNHDISNLSEVIKVESMGVNSNNRFSPMPQTFNAMMYSSGNLAMRITSTQIVLTANSNGSGQNKLYITLFYTKSS